MTLQELGDIFNRAAAGLFSLKKYFFIFLSLILSGLSFLFFLGFAVNASPWARLLVLAIPLFLSLIFLMLAGILTVRVYWLEKEGRSFSLAEIMTANKKNLWRGVYVAIPFLIAAVFCCLLLGLCILIKKIPYIGPFLGVILAFVPFLSLFSLIVLFLVGVVALFIFTPLLASGKLIDRSTVIKNVRLDLFSHLILLLLAILPACFFWWLLSRTAILVFVIYSFGDSVVMKVLQSLFMLIPLAALFAFPITFFFNVALEAYLKREEDIVD